MAVTRFEWDEAKNRANLKKRGIAFELAVRVFDDPLHVTKQDRVENGEVRWQTFGVVAGVVLVMVAHSIIADDEAEVIRLISARKATRRERQRYEQDHDQLHH